MTTYPEMSDDEALELEAHGRYLAAGGAYPTRTQADITPTVNINGTDAQVLIDQQCAVAKALSDALDAMRQAAPNGRDFPGAPANTAWPMCLRTQWDKASSRHIARCEAIRLLLTETNDTALAILDQTQRSA
jgi:hypothetical protein